MDEQAKHDIQQYRERVNAMLDGVEGYANLAAAMTGESPMTADYIWGNCTLEQLEAHLNASETPMDGSEAWVRVEDAQQFIFERNNEMKTKAELEAMGFPATSTIDVESVRNTVHALNEARKTIAAQQAEIVRQNEVIENVFVAIARTGANYDTHNPLRKIWEMLRDELFKKAIGQS